MDSILPPEPIAEDIARLTSLGIHMWQHLKCLQNAIAAVTGAGTSNDTLNHLVAVIRQRLESARRRIRAREWRCISWHDLYPDPTDDYDALDWIAQHALFDRWSERHEHQRIVLQLYCELSEIGERFQVAFQLILSEETLSDEMRRRVERLCASYETVVYPRQWFIDLLLGLPLDPRRLGPLFDHVANTPCPRSHLPALPTPGEIRCRLPLHDTAGSRAAHDVWLLAFLLCCGFTFLAFEVDSACWKQFC